MQKNLKCLPNICTQILSIFSPTLMKKVLQKLIFHLMIEKNATYTIIRTYTIIWQVKVWTNLLAKINSAINLRPYFVGFSLL